jgi:hypothetical protein
MAEKKTDSKTETKVGVEIGFDGGQVITTRLDSKGIEALRKAAESGEGWHTIASEEGEVTIKVKEIVFFRSASPENRVGFGLSS